MGDWKPVGVALLALAVALVWQWAGTTLLAPLVPRSLPRAWRLVLAHLGWLPLSGSWVLLLCLLGACSRPLLLGTSAMVVLAAVVVERRDGHVRLVWAALAGMWTQGTTLGRAGVVVGTLVQAVRLLTAAHPQRLSDQLNYHLVVPALALRDGQPFAGQLDPHVLMAGVVEYAFAWPCAWSDSFFLLNAVAQVAAWLALVPVLVASGTKMAGGGAAALGLMMVAVPSVFPESAIFLTAKPDGFALAATLVLLGMLHDVPSAWTPVMVAVMAMLVGTKVTALHAGVAFLACVRTPKGPWKEALPWLVLCTLAPALHVLKNALHLGNPVYPAAAGIFPSAWSDDATATYWHQVTFFGDESILARLAGPFRYVGDAPVLAVGAALGAVLLRQATVPMGRLLVWLAVYWAVWPLLYGSHIFPRFVAPLGGFLLGVWMLGMGMAPARRQHALVAVMTAAALATSAVDWDAGHLVAWNRGSMTQAYRRLWPRLDSVPVLAAHVADDDVVLADAPEKLFLPGRLLFAMPLSPQEREMVHALAAHPVTAAVSMKLQALVRARDQAMPAEMQVAWDALLPLGTLEAAGGDEVLWSACHFAANPCQTPGAR